MIHYATENAAQHIEPLISTCIGIAGGLSHENVYERVKELGRADICIDAQGRLRTEDKTGLCLPNVDTYLKQAARAFREVP